MATTLSRHAQYYFEKCARQSPGRLTEPSVTPLGYICRSFIVQVDFSKTSISCLLDIGGVIESLHICRRKNR